MKYFTRFPGARLRRPLTQGEEDGRGGGVPGWLGRIPEEGVERLSGHGWKRRGVSVERILLFQSEAWNRAGLTALGGNPRGYLPLAARLWPRRGGSERSERWKGGSGLPPSKAPGQTRDLTKGYAWASRGFGVGSRAFSEPYLTRATTSISTLTSRGRRAT